MLACWLCIFLGFFGAHKFAEKKVKWGLIYFFTLGLFVFGWLFDIFKYYKKYKEIGGSHPKLYLVTAISWILCICLIGSAGADRDKHNDASTNYPTDGAIDLVGDKSGKQTIESDNSSSVRYSQPKDDNGFTWEKLLADQSRYEKVLMLLGENFRAGTTNEALKSELSTDELKLVDELFSYYNRNNDLPSDLKETFTEFCKADQYKDMFYDTDTDNEFYITVTKSFKVSWKSSDGTYYISLYDIPETDYSPDKKYLDAERYVDNGCILYVLENDTYEEYATVEDVLYGTVIDDVCYGFAIKLDFVDDELKTDEYKDGDWFFNIVRSDDGNPKYYVSANDLNRKGQANSFDYESFWNWKQLSDTANKKGLEVYMGAGSCKRHQFTIIDTDVLNDYMLVRYPSGSEEVKSYMAMITNNYLYVMA